MMCLVMLFIMIVVIVGMVGCLMVGLEQIRSGVEFKMFEYILVMVIC